MKSYDERVVEELQKINDHLKNACRLLVTLGGGLLILSLMTYILIKQR